MARSRRRGIARVCRGWRETLHLVQPDLLLHWHRDVTRFPSDPGTAQQLREATPHSEGPRYLIQDNDDTFGSRFAVFADGTGAEVVRTPPRSPNLNPICERFGGGAHRECLDHVLILNENHLRRVLGEYIATYFNPARPHQGLGQRIPGEAGVAPGGRPARRLPRHPYRVGPITTTCGRR